MERESRNRANRSVKTPNPAKYLAKECKLKSVWIAGSGRKLLSTKFEENRVLFFIRNRPLAICSYRYRKY